MFPNHAQAKIPPSVKESSISVYPQTKTGRFRFQNRPAFLDFRPRRRHSTHGSDGLHRPLYELPHRRPDTRPVLLYSAPRKCSSSSGQTIPSASYMGTALRHQFRRHTARHLRALVAPSSAGTYGCSPLENDAGYLLELQRIYQWQSRSF